VVTESTDNYQLHCEPTMRTALERARSKVVLYCRAAKIDTLKTGNKPKQRAESL